MVKLSVEYISEDRQVLFMGWRNVRGGNHRESCHQLSKKFVWKGMKPMLKVYDSIGRSGSRGN